MPGVHRPLILQTTEQDKGRSVYLKLTEKLESLKAREGISSGPKIFLLVSDQDRIVYSES